MPTLGIGSSSPPRAPSSCERLRGCREASLVDRERKGAHLPHVEGIIALVATLFVLAVSCRVELMHGIDLEEAFVSHCKQAPVGKLIDAHGD
eukprot:392498-Prymnesium_polylepis.1